MTSHTGDMQICRTFWSRVVAVENLGYLWDLWDLWDGVEAILEACAWVSVLGLCVKCQV